MKKFLPIITAALTGSIISILILLLFTPVNTKTVQIEHIPGIPLKNAIYTTDNEGNIRPLDFTEASKRVMEAVVNIRCIQKNNEESEEIPGELKNFFDEDFYRYFFNPDGRRRNHARMGMGSGVIINKNGYIVTNQHVIEDASAIEVTLHNNRNYEAEVVGVDEATDLALLQIDEQNLTTVPLVNSDDVEVGDWVLAIGNPYELSSTVTAGIVSAKSRNIDILKDKNAIESFIQTDAAINPGNSGGALVNLDGGLIGINTAIASPTGTYSGYGFAITSNIVAKVVEDLIKFGSVQRGYLGVVIRNIDGYFAKEKGLNTTEGVYIDSIVKSGAAELAGIKPGDIVTKIEGRSIKQASELQEYIARYNPGDEIALTVNRNGSMKELNAFLQDDEGNTKIKLAAKVSNDEDIASILGAELEVIDVKIAESLQIPGGVQVIKLRDGKLNDQTEIKEGFIITRINNKPISTIDDLFAILKNQKGGILIEGVYENREGIYYYALGI